MERVLGTPALFATAYGNVGSSIYCALGLTAVYALGLTPVVFVVAGRRLRRHRGDVRGGDGALPGGGRLVQLRAARVQRARVSFGAAWSQMLVYVVTIATSAFFVPHYLSIFWAPLRDEPLGHRGRRDRDRRARRRSTSWAFSEAARLSIGLAVIDFGTQVLLVLLGFALVFSPDVLVNNIHWGTAPTWANLAVAIPVAMLAYTGVETVSNLAEEVLSAVRTLF